LNHLPVLHCLKELKWSASYTCQSDWLQFNTLMYNILQSKRKKILQLTDTQQCTLVQASKSSKQEGSTKCRIWWFYCQAKCIFDCVRQPTKKHSRLNS
jgi:hypothetical protein